MFGSGGADRRALELRHPASQRERRSPHVLRLDTDHCPGGSAGVWSFVPRKQALGGEPLSPQQLYRCSAHCGVLQVVTA